ncbi:4'-phosphopantetheinyl transferase family protein [Leifsonia poae]|uniref:4'-phosphopantetheinyl transferase family protein n=1 Tax=Leifsonia poae TaxID=110933 RepID=UPI003D673EAE
MEEIVGDATVRRVDAPGSRADRSLAGRAALRELVGDLSGVNPSGILIESRCPDCGGPHGRPVVMAPDAARGIRISLAYAGASAVVAACPGRSVGVDAELADDGHSANADDKRRAILSLAPGDGDPLIRWTRIEAVLKADGRGLRVEPHRVRFYDRGEQLVAGAPDDPRHYEVRDVPLGDDLIVTLALEL